MIKLTVTLFCFLLLLLIPSQLICQITNDQCFACHSTATLQKTIEVSGGTEIVPLFVDSLSYKSSTHHTLQCVQCHTNITSDNLYTHAGGGANALPKTYGSWARFSKSDTTLNTNGSPRTRNYYTIASLSCAQSGCHSDKNGFTSSRHHTIWRLKEAHERSVNDDIVGEKYTKTCSRCHTTCATCHFETNKIQKVEGNILAIWDSLQTQGESKFPNASSMTEWAMDWTSNVASHNFIGASQLTTNNDVCRSCHTGYYRPATYGYLSEEPPYPTANGTSIKRHPQYYESLKSSHHQTQFCANCHNDVHAYPDGDFDWQTQGDANCQDCHSMTDHYAQHTTVDCISCHFTGFAKSVGQDGHDVWRWPVNNRVRPLAVKYKEALSWYPHNIEKPDSISSCADKCHYEGNLVGASIANMPLFTNIPATFELSQNYPNPFNPNTTVSFTVVKPGQVLIAVYDMNGRLVKKLTQTDKMPGIYKVTWDGKDESGYAVSSGLYIAQMTAATFTASRKMLLVR
jgi:hypothetical protein